MSFFGDTGGPFDDSLRSVIEDPQFTEPVVHHELLHDADESGYERPEFGPDTEMEVQITSPDAEDFEITATGPDEDLSYVLTAMTDRGLSDGDRIWYDNGLALAPYRLTAPRTVRFDSGVFAKWALVEDERGEGTGDTGDAPDDGTGSGETSDPIYW